MKKVFLILLTAFALMFSGCTQDSVGGAIKTLPKDTQSCSPLTEICDAIDNDCDKEVDEGNLCEFEEECINGSCEQVPIYQSSKTDEDFLGFGEKQEIQYASDRFLVKFTEQSKITSEAEVLIYVRDISAKQDTHNIIEAKKVIKKSRAVSKSGLNRIFVIKVESEQDIKEIIKEYERDPNVEYVELDYKVEVFSIPNDSFFSYQWTLNNTGQTGGTNDADIDAIEAWDIEEGSEEVIIAIIDTGVDYIHTDLQANIWVNPEEIPNNGIDDENNGFIDDVLGYDFSTCEEFNVFGGCQIPKEWDNDPMDEYGHGTHCAGVAAAVTDNSAGIAGACQNCKIMPVQFMNKQGGGYTSDAIAAIDYSVNNGARILNNSWGGGGYSQALQDTIDDAISNGVLFIAAAGNSDTDNLFYPAAYENVLTVAATDNKDKKASYSNYGNWIDLSAPGGDKYLQPTHTECRLGVEVPYDRWECLKVIGEGPDKCAGWQECLTCERCSDTDVEIYGDQQFGLERSFFINGTVTLPDETSFTDYCVDSQTLMEYSCVDEASCYKGYEFESTQFQCSDGCSNGACNTPTSCNDSDNGDLYVKGLAVGQDNFGRGIAVWDSCYNLSAVAEAYCAGIKVKTEAIDCQEGYYCSESVCVPGSSPVLGCIFPPSISILSTISDGYLWNALDGRVCGFSENNSKYVGLAGTSMASPMVAGVAGLLLSQNPDFTPGVLFGQLKYTTDNIESINPDYQGKLGTGRLNAYAALTTESRPKPVYYKLILNDENSLWPNNYFEPQETVNLFVSLKNEWENAYSVQAQLTSSDPYITIIQGTSGYGDITSLGVKQNTVPFSVKLDESAFPGHEIEFDLLLTYADIENNNFNSTESFTYAVTSDIGWPKLINEHYEGWIPNQLVGSIAFIDLTGDGIDEILLSLPYVSKIVAYTFDGHFIWSHDTTPDSLNNLITAGDIDSDNFPEVIVSSRSGPFSSNSKLYVIEHDGTTKENWHINNYSYAGSSLTDVSGEGVLDIIVDNFKEGIPSLRTFNFQASLLWSRDGFYDRATTSSIGDLDGDDLKEIVTSFFTWSHKSKIITTRANGSDFGTTFSFDNKDVSTSPVLGDLDQDGDLEIIFVAYSYGNNEVYLYHHDGNLATGWPKNVYGTKPAFGPSLADIDGDEDLEIFVAVNNGNLYAWHHNGEPLNDNWPVLNSNGFLTFPIIADFDGDNQPEVLVGKPNCELVAFNIDGSIALDYSKEIVDPENVCSEISQIAVGNLGVNNNLQIGVVGSATNYIGSYAGFAAILNTLAEYNPNNMEWPVYNHDYYRTGLYTKPPFCSDATPYEECSETKPFYCDNGELVEKCWDCGCPVKQKCEKVGGTPTCVPDTNPI